MKRLLFLCLMCLCTTTSSTRLKSDFVVVKTNKKLPYFANYLHRFDFSDNLITRTISSSIQFYAIFPNQLSYVISSSSQSQSLPIFSLTFGSNACQSGPNYVGVQAGGCFIVTTFGLDGSNKCVGRTNDTVSSSISIDAENNTAVRNLLLDFKPCHPSFVDSSVVESNTQCIAIRMMTNRDNTGVELILQKAWYGYPSDEKPDLVIFIIMCALLVMTIVLVIASILAINFSHLFIKPRLVQQHE